MLTFLFCPLSYLNLHLKIAKVQFKPCTLHSYAARIRLIVLVITDVLVNSVNFCKFQRIPENFSLFLFQYNPESCWSWCKLTRKNFPGIPENDYRELSRNSRICSRHFARVIGGEATITIKRLREKI